MALKGIDVSEHQKSIDWNQVKTSGVQFAMLRGGYGKNNIDKYFHANAKGAIAAGIPIGMYWFSYALNVDMARNEAKYAVSLAKQYKITWPIAFDLEYDTVSYAAKNGVTITKDMATQMAKAFCEEIKAAGYTPMNYTNPDYLNRYFDRDQLPYDTWLAQYASQASISDMTIWQYSSSGSVPGVSGNCDVNHGYKNYGESQNIVLPENAGEIEGREESMQCFYTVDGKGPVIWFDGQNLHPLSHPDEMNILNTIYKANNGKDMPSYNWLSKAPWHKRLEAAIKRTK